MARKRSKKSWREERREEPRRWSAKPGRKIVARAKPQWVSESSAKFNEKQSMYEERTISGKVEWGTIYFCRRENQRLIDGCQSFSIVKEYSIFCIGGCVMTEHHRFQDATICRCTSQSEDSDWADGRLDHVIFTPICLFYISTRRSSRRHNVADLEAALICIALKMGQ